MPPTPQPDKDDAHQQLLDQMDIYYTPKPFRRADWKPTTRRNKNIKQIVSEANRREASIMATQNNSGASTPQLMSEGTATPQPNMAQAAQSLSTLVLERNLQKAAAGNTMTSIAGLGPAVTYTNIESAPSLQTKKHYCDITGLPSKYTDPKTKLRYHNSEVFGVIRTFPQGVPDQYLAARGANVILK